MTTAVTYDMQKLDEAVSALAGHGNLRSRLRDAFIPLSTLHMGGMKNTGRAAQFDSIYNRLTGDAFEALDDEGLRQLASDIVDLLNGNWHDTVWALEDKLEALNKRNKGPLLIPGMARK